MLPGVEYGAGVRVGPERLALVLGEDDTAAGAASVASIVALAVAEADPDHPILALVSDMRAAVPSSSQAFTILDLGRDPPSEDYNQLAADDHIYETLAWLMGVGVDGQWGVGPMPESVRWGLLGQYSRKQVARWQEGHINHLGRLVPLLRAMGPSRAQTVALLCLELVAPPGPITWEFLLDMAVDYGTVLHILTTGAHGILVATGVESALHVVRVLRTLVRGEVAPVDKPRPNLPISAIHLDQAYGPATTPRDLWHWLDDEVDPVAQAMGGQQPEQDPMGRQWQIMSASPESPPLREEDDQQPARRFGQAWLPEDWSIDQDEWGDQLGHQSVDQSVDQSPHPQTPSSTKLPGAWQQIQPMQLQTSPMQPLDLQGLGFSTPQSLD